MGKFNLLYSYKTIYSKYEMGRDKRNILQHTEKSRKMLQNNQWRLLNFHPLFIADNVAIFFANFFLLN